MAKKTPCQQQIREMASLAFFGVLALILSEANSHLLYTTKFSSWEPLQVMLPWKWLFYDVAVQVPEHELIKPGHEQFWVRKWVKTKGTVRIVRIQNSHTGDSAPFSVVSYLPLAEDDFSVPSNTGLFLKPYLFVGLVSGKPFLCLFLHLGTFL